MKITNLTINANFRYLWLKTVRDVDLTQHCARSLVGEYDKRIQYKIVKAMVTNFHQPQSTLLLLVSAFVKGNWRTIYDYALSHDFRFLSYGDSSLLIP